MSETEAKDAFIIFDEAYEGNDVDAFYLGDILRALGCNVTNAKVLEAGGAAAVGEKRIAFSDFLPPPRGRQGRSLIHRLQRGLHRGFEGLRQRRRWQSSSRRGSECPLLSR